MLSSQHGHYESSPLPVKLVWSEAFSTALWLETLEQQESDRKQLNVFMCFVFATLSDNLCVMSSEPVC